MFGWTRKWHTYMYFVVLFHKNYLKIFVYYIYYSGYYFFPKVVAFFISAWSDKESILFFKDILIHRNHANPVRPKNGSP